MPDPTPRSLFAIVLATGLLGCDSVVPRAAVVAHDADVDLGSTRLVGHPDVPHEAGVNLLWCATFQLAWDRAAARLGDPLQFAFGTPPLAERLNRHDVAPGDLDDASYVALAGLGEEGIDAAIRDELARKFGDVDTALLPDETAPTDLLAYAYLQKSLSFAEPLLIDVETLKFAGVPVRTFGVRHEAGAEEHWSEVSRQVAILDFVDDTEFVVELETESPADRLVLARVPPAETLAETIAEVIRRAGTETIERLRHDDTFLAPVIDFDVTRRFRELEGHLAREKQEFLLYAALQRVRFRLDERGATLESEAVMKFLSADMGKPRRLALDGPFLVLMLREGAARPYFALWIETPELLIPADSGK